jgi:AcrR family transcriptional regulator
MRRPYDRIRVSAITRKAAVGRATFYAHFATKDALLQAELVRVVSHTLVETPREPCLVECTRLFAHVQHARDIFRSLTAGPAHVITERIIQDALEMRIAEAVTARGNVRATTPTFAPRFVASTLLTLIAWSLEQPSAPSPDELQEIFRSLVGRALDC